MGLDLDERSSLVWIRIRSDQVKLGHLSQDPNQFKSPHGSDRIGSSQNLVNLDPTQKWNESNFRTQPGSTGPLKWFWFS